MKTYEAMILLDNREVKKGWDSLKETVDSILTKRGAELVVAKRWDERKLAYDIKKQRRATYYLSYLKADPSTIDEMRRDLELSVPVLRYLILSCEAIPEDAYEPEKEFTMAEDDVDVEAKGDTEVVGEALGSEEAEASASAGESAGEGESVEEVKPADEDAQAVVAESAAEPVTEEAAEENEENKE